MCLDPRTPMGISLRSALHTKIYSHLASEHVSRPLVNRLRAELDSVAVVIDEEDQNLCITSGTTGSATHSKREGSELWRAYCQAEVVCPEVEAKVAVLESEMDRVCGELGDAWERIADLESSTSSPPCRCCEGASPAADEGYVARLLEELAAEKRRVYELEAANAVSLDLCGHSSVLSEQVCDSRRELEEVRGQADSEVQEARRIVQDAMSALWQCQDRSAQLENELERSGQSSDLQTRQELLVATQQGDLLRTERAEAAGRQPERSVGDIATELRNVAEYEREACERSHAEQLAVLRAELELSRRAESLFQSEASEWRSEWKDASAVVQDANASDVHRRKSCTVETGDDAWCTFISSSSSRGQAREALQAIAAVAPVPAPDLSQSPRGPEERRRRRHGSPQQTTPRKPGAYQIAEFVSPEGSDQCSPRSMLARQQKEYVSQDQVHTRSPGSPSAREREGHTSPSRAPGADFEDGCQLRPPWHERPKSSPELRSVASTNTSPADLQARHDNKWFQTAKGSAELGSCHQDVGQVSSSSARYRVATSSIRISTASAQVEECAQGSNDRAHGRAEQRLQSSRQRSGTTEAVDPRFKHLVAEIVSTRRVGVITNIGSGGSHGSSASAGAKAPRRSPPYSP